MGSEQMVSRVRELRRAGLTPKQIGRELGLTKAELQPLLRQTAGSQHAVVERAFPEPGARELVGCWVSPGWSIGLGLADAAEWAALDPGGGDGQDGYDNPTGGLAAVMIARADRFSKVAMCGFLVDVHCLGAKNTLGPQIVGSSEVHDFARRFFSGFADLPGSVPLELAQHLVHGAVAYAAHLGFEPHEHYPDVEPFLGPAPERSLIQFGRDGLPFYVEGPYDDSREVIATLDRTVGAGNYHYVIGVGQL